MTVPQSIILYDDGEWSAGHYRSVFCLYAEAFLSLGLRVHAVCPQPEAVLQWIGLHAPDGSGRFTGHRVRGRTLKVPFRSLKPLSRLLWCARAARTIHRIHRAEGVVVPAFFMNINHLRGPLWTDRLAGSLFRFPWAAFTYDSSIARQDPVDLRRLEQSFGFLHTAGCRAFGTTDEKMITPLQQVFPGIHIVFVPDTTPEEIADPGVLAQEAAQQAKGRRIVLLPGALHKRKGLLTAIALAKSRPDLFFVFAGALDLGKLTPEEAVTVSSFFNQPPPNCFCHLQRVEDEAELNALVRRADLVLAVYPGFTNSSGILTKAGLLGTPCLVADGDTCMADRARKYRLGACVPAGDMEACLRAIDDLAASFKPPDTSAFRRDFSAAALQQSLKQVLDALRSASPHQ